MSDTPAVYTASTRHTNVNGLYHNHYKFSLEALPDLSFFVQSVTLPSLTSAAISRPTPFTYIKETPDHLTYGAMSVTFKIDAELQTYKSLFWWMKGYGFPHSYEEVVAFREARKAAMSNPRPQARDMEKTTGIIHVLLPDTDSIMAEFRFFDIFPTSIGEMNFVTTSGDAEELRCTATFEYTDFDLFLP